MPDLNGFDANVVEPIVGFEPIPAGDYLAAITASEMKPTKAGTGEFLEIEFQVLDGVHQGRKLWTRLNLKNPNQKAVKFARGELSAICHAVGVMTPKDAMDLHDKPLVIKVALKPREDTGEMTNVIKGYASKGAASAPARNPSPEPVAVADDNTPPWKKTA